MPTLNELRETLFSDRPVTQIFFGEPDGRPIMDKVLRKSKIEPIDVTELDETVIRQLSVGTYPILFQAYDGFRFDTIVPEDRLREYLREHLDRPEPRIMVSFADRDTQVVIVQRFIGTMRRRPFTVVPVDTDIKLYFHVQYGDILGMVTIARVSVPGTPVLA